MGPGSGCRCTAVPSPSPVPRPRPETLHGEGRWGATQTAETKWISHEPQGSCEPRGRCARGAGNHQPRGLAGSQCGSAFPASSFGPFLQPKGRDFCLCTQLLVRDKGRATNQPPCHAVLWGRRCTGTAAGRKHLRIWTGTGQTGTWSPGSTGTISELGTRADSSRLAATGSRRPAAAGLPLRSPAGWTDAETPTPGPGHALRTRPIPSAGLWARLRPQRMAEPRESWQELGPRPARWSARDAPLGSGNAARAAGEAQDPAPCALLLSRGAGGF